MQVKEPVAAQNAVANTAAKETQPYPVFPAYTQETYDFVAGRRAGLVKFNTDGLEEMSESFTGRFDRLRRSRLFVLVI